MLTLAVLASAAGYPANAELHLARAASPTVDPSCVTYRLKCSTIFSSRTCSGKFPTQRCLVSRTIVRYSSPRHTHKISHVSNPCRSEVRLNKMNDGGFRERCGPGGRCPYCFSSCVPEHRTRTRSASLLAALGASCAFVCRLRQEARRVSGTDDVCM